MMKVAVTVFLLIFVTMVNGLFNFDIKRYIECRKGQANLLDVLSELLQGMKDKLLLPNEIDNVNQLFECFLVAEQLLTPDGKLDYEKLKDEFRGLLSIDVLFTFPEDFDTLYAECSSEESDESEIHVGHLGHTYIELYNCIIKDNMVQ